MSNIKIVGHDVSIAWITFSDKTETCKVVGEVPPTVRVQVNIEDGTRDLIRIGLVKDALDRLGVQHVNLTLDYVPQARADRVFEEGNPLPIKVFCNILNSYSFNEVVILDPHSDVTPALINNVKVIPQEICLSFKLPEIKDKLGEDFTVVAPDQGSTKKVFDVIKMLGHKECVQGIKHRDVSTGNIDRCDLTVDKVSGNMLIVDDLVDGGASFKFLAKKLKEKGAEKVGVYITHAILPKGLKVLEEDVDYIWYNTRVGDCPTYWEFNER